MDADLDDLPTIEIIAEEEKAASEGDGPGLTGVVGGLDPHGLYYPKQREDGSVTLPRVRHGESGNHYYDRIYSGEDQGLPDGYYGPPRPLSVKEVFEKGHCGIINAQAALKYGGRSRGR